MGDMPGEIDIDLHFDLPQALGGRSVGAFGGIGGGAGAAVPTQVILYLLWDGRGRGGLLAHKPCIQCTRGEGFSRSVSYKPCR